MPLKEIPRYRPTYREDEIRLIARLALRGDSMGFVGIAGVGKSNVVNFLNEGRIGEVAGKEAEVLLFPVVDGTYWQRTPGSLWEMMLDALKRSTKHLPQPQQDKILPMDQEERTLDKLRAMLEWFCRDLKYKVVFVMDDFDEVFKTGPIEMLELLNGLRSEGNREALSYVVFTKRLPHVLGRTHNLNIENGSKFYDLFSKDIYALEPYKPEDAYQMLVHLNEKDGKPLQDAEIRQVFRLAGGHAGLLRTVFRIWADEGTPNGDPTTYFVNKHDVREECRRILAHLHEDEQAVALKLARREDVAKQKPVVTHLARRGLLLSKQTNYAWFSPLFGRFLGTL